MVVVNAGEVLLSGKKKDKKVYTRYTGCPGGLRTVPFETLIEEKPEEVITEAVRKMSPHTKSGNRMLRRLRVYAGPEHEQAAQKSVLLEIKPR